VLAVSLGFIVLLSILDEPATALLGSFLSFASQPVLHGLHVSALLELFLKARVRPGAVLPLGVPLRSFLISLAHRYDPPGFPL